MVLGQIRQDRALKACLSTILTGIELQTNLQSCQQGRVLEFLPQEPMSEDNKLLHLESWESHKIKFYRKYFRCFQPYVQNYVKHPNSSLNWAIPI